MKLNNAGISSFQWSTSEQIWPFEKASDGSTLYCKQVSFGALPNNGSKSVAHNITSFSPTKLHRMEALSGNSSQQEPTPNSSTSGTQYQIASGINTTDVYIITGVDRSSYNAIFYLIYAK
jgi:hypothetical protein